jgi:hypothetical protein
MIMILVTYMLSVEFRPRTNVLSMMDFCLRRIDYVCLNYFIRELLVKEAHGGGLIEHFWNC